LMLRTPPNCANWNQSKKQRIMRNQKARYQRAFVLQ